MKVNQTGCRKMCSLKEALCDVVQYVQNYLQKFILKTTTKRKTMNKTCGMNGSFDTQAYTNS